MGHGRRKSDPRNWLSRKEAGSNLQGNREKGEILLKDLFRFLLLLCSLEN